jgi:phosphoglycerate dehydrogenase-like enzyme
MHAFIYASLNEASKALLKQALPENIIPSFRNELTEAAQKVAFQRAELIFGNPPLEWWTTPPPHLKFWQIDSAGFEGYQSLRLTIPVCNMGDYYAWPCAETIVGGVLALYRQVHTLAVLQAQQKWVGVPIRFLTQCLNQQRVVVLGAGTIGMLVKKILLGFDCQVKIMARTHPNADIFSREELAAELPHTDLVVNCLPGSAAGFFSADLIAKMKPGSVFANVGRGNTVDEAALIAALQSGQLGGAVLDVTLIEPLPLDSPLWRMENVVLTQHTGGGSKTEYEGKVPVFTRNVERFLNGQALENQVDLARGY